MSLLLCMYVRMPTEYRVVLLTTLDLMTSTHARSLLATGTIDNTKRELARIYSVSFLLTKVQLIVCLLLRPHFVSLSVTFFFSLS